MTLSTLRTRIETATEAQQAEVLYEAFVALIKPFTPQNEDPDGRECLFVEMVTLRAYESAALLIMREVLPGWNYMFGMRVQDHARAYVNNGISKYVGGGMKLDPKSRWFENTAPTPALAIIAAICAAKGDGDA